MVILGVFSVGGILSCFGIRCRGGIRKLCTPDTEYRYPAGLVERSKNEIEENAVRSVYGVFRVMDGPVLSGIIHRDAPESGQLEEELGRGSGVYRAVPKFFFRLRLDMISSVT